MSFVNKSFCCVVRKRKSTPHVCVRIFFSKPWPQPLADRPVIFATSEMTKSFMSKMTGPNWPLWPLSTPRAVGDKARAWRLWHQLMLFSRHIGRFLGDSLGGKRHTGKQTVREPLRVWLRNVDDNSRVTESHASMCTLTRDMPGSKWAETYTHTVRAQITSH